MGFHKLCKYNSFWQKTAVFVELLNNIGKDERKDLQNGNLLITLSAPQLTLK